ncbi:MAG: hypothetical protein AAFV72_20560 [Cyanobacteria bacterium J06635_1]
MSKSNPAGSHDNSEPKASPQTPKKKRKLWDSIVHCAIVENYETTFSFIGKLVWPFFSLIILLLFYSDITKLLKEFSTNLSRTSRITIAGIELEIYEAAIPKKDEKAYAIIGLLTREELLLILELSDATFYLNSRADNFINEVETTAKSLQEYGLITMKYDAITPAGVDADVEIKLTGLGIRVYEELQNLLIGIILELPEATD